MKFYDFELADEVLDAIESMGFDTPTPIQEQAIPAILEGRDIIGSAQTGTGKTAAFLLPVIDKILNSNVVDKVQALIIVPTRELAIQINQQMDGFSYFASVSSIAVYGGGDGNLFEREKQALKHGVDLIVGTPGRLIAHLNMPHVDMSHINTLILDEADRMLDMGFYDDIMKIINQLPKARQNLFFSATMPPKIRQMARKILHDPVEINIAISKPAEKVVQVAYILYENQKLPLLNFLLKNIRSNSILIFCSTKTDVKMLTRELKRQNLQVGEIHSDLEQKEREEILLQFKSKNLHLLVATDIISRGIDIEDIDLIINYNVPSDGEDYIHRIGRTARAESDGMAITLVNQADQDKFGRIEDLIESEVEKGVVPESLGETPEYNPRGQNKKKQSYGKGKGKRPVGSNNNKHRKTQRPHPQNRIKQ